MIQQILANQVHIILNAAGCLFLFLVVLSYLKYRNGVKQMALSKAWRNGKYGVEYLMLTPDIRGVVAWENGKYVGRFDKAKVEGTDLAAVKAALEAKADEVLSIALARLRTKQQLTTVVTQCMVLTMKGELTRCNGSFGCCSVK